MIKIKEPHEYYTPEDIARHKRKADLKATGRRIDDEIAAVKNAQDDGKIIDQEKYINALIDGKDIDPPKNHTARLDELRRQRWNIEQALDVLEGKEYTAQIEAKKRLCLDLKPQSDLLTKQLAEAMFATHKIHLEYFKTKRLLIGNGIGLHGGVFSADVEQFFGIPSDKPGTLGNYFRDAVKGGFLKGVPEGLK